MLDCRQRSVGIPVRFTAVAIAGILAGVYFVGSIAQQTLNRRFAVFLMVMGALILFQNRAVFGLL